MEVGKGVVGDMSGWVAAGGCSTGWGLGWAAMWQLTKKKRLKTKRRYLMRLRQLSWADIFA